MLIREITRMIAESGRIAIIAGVLAAASAAQAQTQAPSQGAPSTIQGDRSDNLSGKLSQSGGVIKPTGNVDPRIQTGAPTPRPNTMPVIPPSATGGQNAK